MKASQSHPVLCDPVYCTVNGILQARILEWAAIFFSRESSQPRDQTQVSHIAGGFFTNELSEKPIGGKGLPKNIRALKKVMVV